MFDVEGYIAGRIWAGHNILRFDCARIREAFAEIGRQPPQPKGAIDSLTLLTQRFGRRAGDMKVQTKHKKFNAFHKIGLVNDGILTLCFRVSRFI